MCSSVLVRVAVCCCECHVELKCSGTGWRRLIGSPKLQIFSTKEPLNIGHFCGRARARERAQSEREGTERESESEREGTSLR